MIQLVSDKILSQHYTEEQLNEINQWFDSTAKPVQSIDGETTLDMVTVEDFQSFLDLKKYHRRQFHYPSYAEIMTEVENFKADVTRKLSKEQILFLLVKWIISPDIKHELKLAFAVFDTEKRGFLEIDEISTIVTTYGDIYDEDEVCEMLRDANVRGDGNVFYNDFIESIFSLAPSLQSLEVEYLYTNPDEDPSIPPLPPEPEKHPEVPVTPPLPPSAPTAQKKNDKKKAQK